MVLRDLGQAKATTKEIARVAGCSEGSLYTYFANKETLLYAVMSERLPPFIPMLNALMARAGEDTLRENLEEIARIAMPFYVESLPLAATVLSTPELKDSLRRQNLGPHRGNETLAAYLRLEQRLGRIRSGANVQAAAALLLGACQQRAMHMQFTGKTLNAEADDAFVKDLVATLLYGLQPSP
ncbi:MAG: TetR family transcriptional regulator [Chloroflexi bacterium]|nr:TetR family transcriptional regulator [Chloroflexota bacterium]